MRVRQWRQVREIFEQAVELDDQTRQRYLAAACGNDAALRREVELMLAADEAAPAFLESSPFDQVRNEQALTSEEMPAGGRLGPYRLLRQIGRGGMGTVWLAERDDAQFRQQVAIKIIRRGMDTEDILRRFRTERQILATLNHPNIARLLDGGSTPDGRPYYVMEYIAGRSIDEYCSNNELSVPERLRLFRSVCAAVSYAHQRLVIHRDLKPSNMLVTDDGTVKLLDFGIARLLTPESAEMTVTATRYGIMTPAYASPEQASGGSITTASDVYSLGVVLYELLTGQRPYQFTTTRPDEIVRVICEQEPEPPGRIRKPEGGRRKAEDERQRAAGSEHRTNGSGQKTEAREHWMRELMIRLLPPFFFRLPASALCDELDNIVLMALRKDAQRRYASVEQFAEDIHRYLSGQPVLARPDTIGYRFTKFVQRNKVIVTAALIVLLSLCSGIVMTWRQAQIARRERALAERRFAEVRELANSFVFRYHDAIAGLPGATRVREMMMKDAVAYLDRLAQEADSNPKLQLELASAWLRIGDVQGQPYRGNLGDTQGALRSYQNALQLCEALARRDPYSPEIQQTLSLALDSIGILQTRSGQFEAALIALHRATSIRERLQQRFPAQSHYTRLLATSYLHLGDAVLRTGRTVNGQSAPEQSLVYFQQSQNLRTSLFAGHPDDLNLARDLAISHQRIGNVLYKIGAAGSYQQSLAAALAHHKQAQAIFERIAAAAPGDAQARRDVVDQFLMKAEAQARAGDVDGALADCRHAIMIFAEMSAADATNIELRRDLATAWYIAGVVANDAGRLQTGIDSMEQALEIYESLASSDAGNTENLSDLLSGYNRLGSMEAQRGSGAKAAQAFRRSIEFRMKLASVSPAEAHLRAGVADAWQILGRHCCQQAAKARAATARKAWLREAKEAFQQALEIRQELARQDQSAADQVSAAQRELSQCQAALDRH
ncbi:MAG TPA: serine/threonine-protein kinase [Blastocatellia bacterium]|nr:serine/threonine-protein kinase [Blastocatellia bacterium]